jgi:Na/Pi-cotransporter
LFVKNKIENDCFAYWGKAREIEGFKMSFGTILTMAGGLGLFLFGMELMSDSIEKVAGARLRRILEIFTTNRFMGMIVGIIFTGIIQSSSACTVMVVSFVNSGLMNLYQAAGVILGANIGTTITSQLVSFNLSKIAPLILLVGVVVMMFTKKEKVRKVAEVVVGFGILFVGLSTMSQAMANMKNEPQVVNLLMSLKNPFLATLMGFALTAIIQSSSVTVSIVLLLANQDLLPLPITLYIILGCNIGACATAMLASMTGKKDAKRAALIHLLQYHRYRDHLYCSVRGRRSDRGTDQVYLRGQRPVRGKCAYADQDRTGNYAVPVHRLAGKDDLPDRTWRRSEGWLQRELSVKIHRRQSGVQPRYRSSRGCQGAGAYGFSGGGELKPCHECPDHIG